jgi:hypothetical protein
MSMHMGGPRGSAEIAFAREQHRKKQKEMAESSFRWEEETTMRDVLAYLRETGRGDLCTDLTDCKPGRYEPALVSDLADARRDGNADAVRRLRSLILAGSRPANRNASPRDAVEAARELIDREESVARSMGRTDPEEMRERGEATDELRAVVRAIRDERVGDTLEHETITIEDRYGAAVARVLRERQTTARRQALRDLHRHRLVRDEIYFARLYPGRAEARYVMLAPNEKPPRAG